MTEKMLEAIGDNEEVKEFVLKSENPADALSALVREFADVDSMDMKAEVQAAWELGIGEEDDEGHEEEAVLQTDLGEDEELLAWMHEQFPDEDVDEAMAQLEEQLAEVDAAKASMDGEAEDDKVPDEEGDINTEDDSQTAKDWRRLEKLMANEPEKDPNNLPKGERHQWFESRSLAPGTALPTAAQAGPNPLEAVFGVLMDSPQPRADGKVRKTYYPGQDYQPKDLNPHNDKGFDEPRNIARMKFNQLVRQRMRKDPFEEKKFKLPGMRDVATLTRFVTDTGKISPRRRSGVSSQNQRHLKKMIKRARTFGLLPYTSKLQRPQ